MRLPQPESPSYKWLVFATIAIGTFLSVVDIGIVNLALPRIESAFHTDLPTVQWVAVGYALAISALLLPLGRLGDLVGRKRVYITGLGIFVVAVTLGGLSQSIGMLIATRAIQGIGSAMMQAQGMATVVSAFPDRERGKALGSHLSVVGSGAIAGPAVGGFLVSSFGWRSVFYVNIPFAVIAMVAAWRVLERGPAMAHRPSGPIRFDWPGALLSGGVLLTFLLVLGEGHRLGWTSAPILGGAVLFLALLAAFISWELRAPMPMLDLRLFKRRLVAFGIASGFINFMGNASVIFMMTFYLQQVLGHSPREAGLILIPGPISLAFWGPVSGRLSDRFGWRRFNIAGQALSASALFLLATNLTDHSPLAFIIPILILNSSGTGLFNSPNNSSILSAVERSKLGVVSALTQLSRNSAQVTSIALSTTIVVATMAAMGFEPSLDTVKAGGNPGIEHAFVSGLHRVYLVMGCLVAFGMALSFLKGEKAAQRAPEPHPAVIHGAVEPPAPAPRA